MAGCTDDDLIRMYRDGDADAFDVLFDRYHSSVYGFACSLLADAGSAEEIMQDTFLAVARTARSYTPQGHFRTWLLRIVRNRCLNRLDAERRRRAAIAESGLTFVEPEAPGPSPADRAATQDRTAHVREAIGRLPERQREALSLYAFEQLGYRQIAEVLETPLNTVKTLIYQARANLARDLAEEGVDT